MTRRISFFSYTEWDSDRMCVAFIALVDGLRIRCLIREEALVELVPEAASPTLAFQQHREQIEEFARTLIQRGRLDGHELVIRVEDVRELRTAPANDPPVPAPPQTEPVDGRRMTMPGSDVDEVWRSICDRQRQACAQAEQGAAPDVANRARGELEAFETLAAPRSAHELNLRRVEATRMASAWRAS